MLGVASTPLLVYIVLSPALITAHEPAWYTFHELRQWSYIAHALAVVYVCTGDGLDKAANVSQAAYWSCRQYCS